MKEIALIIFTAMVLTSCLLRKTPSHNSQAIPLSKESLRKYAEAHVKSSLQSGEADTVLIYELGCSGCIRNISRIYLIYSSDDGFVKATKLQPGSSYKIFAINNIFSFFKENFLELQEEGENLPLSYASHFHFRRLEVRDADSVILSFEYQFPNHYEQLINKAPLRWINMIDSELLWLEVAQLK